MIDRLEKLGRLVLWLTLASAVVLVPIIYIRQRTEEAARAELAAQNEQRRALEAKEAEKSVRLSLASMGDVIHRLSTATATGHIAFSNVSPRSGVVCIAGVATNPDTNAKTESLASCKRVGAYDTNVDMQVSFAGGDLSAVCKGVTCAFTFREVPDAPAQ